MYITPAAIAQYMPQLAPSQAAGEPVSTGRQPDTVRPTQRVELTKDRAYFSQEAQDLLAQEERSAEGSEAVRDEEALASRGVSTEDPEDENDKADNARRGESQVQDPHQLTEVEERVVDELQQRDREVRQHEQAHLSAAGGLAQGGIQYQFQRGPDGRSYAVGGSVRIDTAPVPGDPAATVRKMAQVRRAALAPLEPSSTDRAVAQQASATASQARQELAANGGKSAEEAAEAAQSAESHASSVGTDVAGENQQDSEPEPLTISRLYHGLFLSRGG